MAFNLNGFNFTSRSSMAPEGRVIQTTWADVAEPCRSWACGSIARAATLHNFRWTWPLQKPPVALITPSMAIAAGSQRLWLQPMPFTSSPPSLRRGLFVVDGSCQQQSRKSMITASRSFMVKDSCCTNYQNDSSLDRLRQHQGHPAVSGGLLIAGRSLTGIWSLLSFLFQTCLEPVDLVLFGTIGAGPCKAARVSVDKPSIRNRLASRPS